VFLLCHGVCGVGYAVAGRQCSESDEPACGEDLVEAVTRRVPVSAWPSGKIPAGASQEEAQMDSHVHDEVNAEECGQEDGGQETGDEHFEDCEDADDSGLGPVEQEDVA